jgi:hypothetical protein
VRRFALYCWGLARFCPDDEMSLLAGGLPLQ